MLIIQVTANYTEFKSRIKQNNRFVSNDNPVISAYEALQLFGAVIGGMRCKDLWPGEKLDRPRLKTL